MDCSGNAGTLLENEKSEVYVGLHQVNKKALEERGFLIPQVFRRRVFVCIAR